MAGVPLCGDLLRLLLSSDSPQRAGRTRCWNFDCDILAPQSASCTTNWGIARDSLPAYPLPPPPCHTASSGIGVCLEALAAFVVGFNAFWPSFDLWQMLTLTCRKSIFSLMIAFLPHVASYHCQSERERSPDLYNYVYISYTYVNARAHPTWADLENFIGQTFALPSFFFFVLCVCTTLHKFN